MRFLDDCAVSEIVGEMFLLVIAITLVAILSANIGNFIPAFEDVPYATFIGKNVSNSDNFTIIHEGGESLPLSGLRVIIDNGSVISCYFEGNNLVCGGIAGQLRDLNLNNRWDFGEILEIYKKDVGNKISITIADERNVLCKIFLGD
ncbi:hypothetical protein DRP07_12600 [Archaeoglobales archaeon]|nr:MAG: hypothetical protein DRP07_12600 [Archaeoglobales archaeon]